MAITRKYEEIDPNSIYTTNISARQCGIDKNIDDLAQSIELQGLFSPILVVAINDGKYELIAGQRRMRAYRDILSIQYPERFSKISAFVYENLKDWEKKAMSINENFNQIPLSEEDKIAAVTACFNQFNSMTITSKKTGIPYRHVQKYVKYERLPKVLKDLKDNGEIRLDVAIETADLYDLDTSNIGEYSEMEIKKAALQMQKLVPKQWRKAKERRKETGEKPYNIIIDIGKECEITRELVAEITIDTYARVEQFKDQKSLKSPEMAISELIEGQLEKEQV